MEVRFPDEAIHGRLELIPLDRKSSGRLIRPARACPEGPIERFGLNVANVWSTGAKPRSGTAPTTSECRLSHRGSPASQECVAITRFRRSHRGMTPSSFGNEDFISLS